MMPGSYKRVDWVDFAKGLGIVLVVIGHSGIPKTLSAWIWSFHMPLFFFISGLFFNNSKYPTLASFAKKRIQTLLKPYVIFSLIVFLWAYLMNSKFLHFQFSELYLGWNGLALWFIPTLFATEILFYLIRKKIDSQFLTALILLLSSTLGYLCYLYEFHLPFKLEVVFTAILFYGLGFLFGKDINIVVGQLKSTFLLLLIAVISVAHFVIATLNSPQLDMASNTLGYPVPTFIAAALGIILLFSISIVVFKLGKNAYSIFQKSISFIGKNTFVILAFHQIVGVTLKTVLNATNIPTLAQFGIRQCSLWIILVALIYIINYHTPWVLGKAGEKKSAE